MPEDLVAASARARRRSEKSGFFHFCPLFTYLLILYVIVESFWPNVREVLFAFSGYALTWVEVFYILAAFFAIFELLKVAEPRVNNTTEAIWITIAWVAYFALFVLGAAGGKIWFVRFGIFNNTEFLVLMVFSGFQAIAAFLINSSTLQLQIADTRSS